MCYTDTYAQSDLYSNKQIQEWSQLFVEKKHKELLLSIEKELQSKTPNPMASMAWLKTHEALGNLDTAYEQLPVLLKEKLATIVDIYRSTSAELPLKYPLSKITRINNWSELYQMIITDDKEDVDSKYSYELRKYALRQYPVAFNTFLAIRNVVINVSISHHDFVKEYQNGEFDYAPSFKKYAEKHLNKLPSTNYDFLFAIDVFLKDYPNDATAWRMKGATHYDLEQYKQAISAYEKAFDIDPLIRNGFYSLQGIAQSKAKLQKFKEVEKITERLAGLYKPNDSKAFKYLYWAQVLRKTGDRGQARKILEKAIQEFPGHPEINFEFGLLENVDKRFSYAIPYFRKAVDTEPKNLSYQKALIKAYKDSGSLDHALDQFQAVHASNNHLSEALYFLGSDIFNELEEYQASLELVQSALEFYPQSDWLYRQLTFIHKKINNIDEAITTLHTSFQYYRPYNWAINILTDLLNVKYKKDKDKVLKELNKLAEQFPWVEDIWGKIEKLCNSNDEKIVVWKKAIEKNLGRLFPYEKLRYIYSEKEEWNNIIAMYEEATPIILKYGGEEDKVNLYFEKAIPTILKLRTAPINDDEWETAKDYLNAYFEKGGYTGAYYEFMAELYYAKNNMEKAKKFFAKKFNWRPDADPAALIIKYHDYKEGYKRLTRYAERAPYEKNRLQRLIRTHVYYPGSPIAALIYAQQFTERFGSRLEYLEARAYGQLGDNSMDFEIRYQNEKFISSSYRYVDWYNSSRKRAWAGSANVKIEAAKQEAIITLPKGVVVKRQDNIRYGKIKHLQIGAVYVSADYDENGNLTILESSSGRRLELSYNTEEHISQMIDQEGGKEKTILDFEYNRMAKPIVISMKGVGSINIDYDENGEILNVESEQGFSMSLKVTQSFQNLLSLTKSFEQFNLVTNLKVPDLGIKDPVYEKLKEEFSDLNYDVIDSETQNQKQVSTWIEKGLKLCKYMYKNISANEDHGPNILLITEQIIRKATQTLKLTDRDRLLEAVRLYHDTLDKLRYRGVDEETWEKWVEISDWLELEKLGEKKLTQYRKNIEALQKYISENPIQLLADATWLPKSFLHNTGFWKKYGYSVLVPEHVRDGLLLNRAFYRSNGDVLLGTNKGLSILRKGYWEWMGFNDFEKKFQPELAASKIRGTSHITSFEETSDNTLYIGTLNGLLAIGKDYEEKGHKKYTDIDGLPANNITHLIAVNNTVFIGTGKGIVRLQNGKIKPVQEIQGSNVRILKSKIYSDTSPHQTAVLVGTEKGLFLAVVQGEKDSITFTQIHSESGTDAILGVDQFVYLLKGKELYRLIFQEKNKSFTPVKLSGTIITTKADKVFGLTTVLVKENEEALAVMTDYGLSLYHKKHFEHFRLPLSDQNSWAKDISHSKDGNAMTVITEDGILAFQYQNMKRMDGEIHDILYVDALGMTFIADGNNVKYIISDDAEEIIRDVEDDSFYSTTTHLAADKQNRVILNDGRMVFRFTFDPDTKALIIKEELFYCEQTEVEDFEADDITSIIVDSGGTLWVTAGLSLFRYKDEGTEAEEFNYFLDPVRFPSRTYHIDKVIETIDGRILVVASNEGHLDYNGISMAGGLLEWEPEKERFIRTTDKYKERGYSFFITGYTPISNDLAIVGTLGGFAEDRQGNIRDYNESGGGIKNLSYNAIFDARNSLFSGTKGAKLGNFWLFGSASGVLVYHDGMWFYPERFNQMLPDDMELSKYGSRHVNTIATDKNGKIYVGTARGLAIYDSHGEDPMSFLIHNLNPTDAFMHQNMNILQEERDIVLSSIPKESETGQLLEKIKKQKQEIKEIERNVAINQQEKIRGPGGTINTEAKKTVETLLKTIESKKQRHAELLLTLQQKEPSVYQLVTLPPLNLLASREKMKKNEAIIQYIPARKSLFVQVLAKDKILLCEVKISRKTLMEACKEAHELLAQDAEAPSAENESVIKEKLSFLYDQLLRPIYNDIKKYENIYVVPSQSLYYIPFSALTKKISSKKYNYAVEDMNIGYVSSMYLFNLIYNFKPSKSHDILLMGDPDGSLSSARKEIETIEKVDMKGYSFTKYVGYESTSKNFKNKAAGSCIVHLATHGYLDRKSAKDSWLLFADKKVTMGELYNLSMNNTELVTLSACQTGLGNNGMEYVTLARAFTTAGAPTVLATLWKVEDKSANELFVKFYQYFSQGDNKFIALAKAQRNLIDSDNLDFSRTARWSAFIPIGKY